MSRDAILHKVRTALGRSVGQPPAPVPPVRLSIPDISVEERIEMMFRALAALAGKTCLAASPQDVRDYVESVVAGGPAVAANAPVLEECGITGLPGVASAFGDEAALRAACSRAGCGITGCDYALADTGTLVMLSSPGQARMVSLLPPVHVAVVRRSQILTGLDELFSLLPRPGEVSSSMVLITGPSRTADIEQILVRGVHGPGEIHVLVL